MDLKAPLEELDVMIRTFNDCKRVGIDTVGRACVAVTNQDLVTQLGIVAFGPRTWRDLDERLAVFGKTAAQGEGQRWTG